MSQLRKLNLAEITELDATHAAVVRQLHQLHELHLPSWISWAKLLAPGHCLQLRTFFSMSTAQAGCDALATLPSLTRVELWQAKVSHIDSLAELPPAGEAQTVRG